MPAVTPRRSRTLWATPAIAGPGTRTLCIDIGGTGVKAIILDREGVPLTDRAASRPRARPRRERFSRASGSSSILPSVDSIGSRWGSRVW